MRTPLTDAFLSDPKAMAWMQMHTPNGAVPGPDVCGEAAVFLLGDAAWHIHGQMLLVDGGMSAWQQPDVPGLTGISEFQNFRISSPPPRSSAERCAF